MLLLLLLHMLSHSNDYALLHAGLELALLVARPPFKKSSQGTYFRCWLHACRSICNLIHIFSTVYDEEEDKFPEDGYYTDE